MTFKLMIIIIPGFLKTGLAKKIREPPPPAQKNIGMIKRTPGNYFNNPFLKVLYLTDKLSPKHSHNYSNKYKLNYNREYIRRPNIKGRNL